MSREVAFHDHNEIPTRATIKEFEAHVLNEEQIGTGAEMEFSSDFKIQNLEQGAAGTKFSAKFQKIRTRQQADSSW
ncbi:hypothetical protein H5410_017892 [Solanum commersonii]|uniref:Uncharacterized protein n=1 Tax=Solanum commersonii TaxID=4109 RepID=A0A9J6A1M7_SOLCO|nr:hypothetical protein H5410_017892 [Solanum commersonii]